jgi:hypothetical protein
MTQRSYVIIVTCAIAAQTLESVVMHLPIGASLTITVTLVGR